VYIQLYNKTLEVPTCFVSVFRDWVILFLHSSCQLKEQWVLYYDVTSIELEASSSYGLDGRYFISAGQ
jgi:hypothetical protein